MWPTSLSNILDTAARHAVLFSNPTPKAERYSNQLPIKGVGPVTNALTGTDEWPSLPSPGYNPTMCFSGTLPLLTNTPLPPSWSELSLRARVNPYTSPISSDVFWEIWNSFVESCNKALSSFGLKVGTMGSSAFRRVWSCERATSSFTKPDLVSDCLICLHKEQQWKEGCMSSHCMILVRNSLVNWYKYQKYWRSIFRPCARLCLQTQLSDNGSRCTTETAYRSSSIFYTARNKCWYACLDQR